MPPERCAAAARTENAEFFRHAIGGYGLFGVVTSVKLRLPVARQARARGRGDRQQPRRERINERIAGGFTYGDFISCDSVVTRSCEAVSSPCYRPWQPDRPSRGQRSCTSDWLKLIRPSHHVDRPRLFRSRSFTLVTTPNSP